MKRGLVLLLSILLLANFVLAVEEPNIYGTGEEDAEKLDGLIKNYTPINEDGEFDIGVYNGTLTQFEEKIVTANVWLAGNSAWLSIVFGMVPEISWLFVINLYFFLLFLTYTVLNISFFTWVGDDKRARIVGACVFIGLLVTKLYLILARGVVNVINLLWTKIIPISAIVGVIVAVIVIVLLIAFPGILAALARWAEAYNEAKKIAQGVQAAVVLKTEAEEMQKKV